MEVVYNVRHFYHLAMSKGDPRVNDWLLMETPIPVVIIFVSYLLMVKFGPKLMEHRKPLQFHNVLIAYNLFMVLLSAYMFYEFLMSAVLAGYSIRCQPVDYSNNPIAIRMAKVCWLYFFSKIIEILDTIFFILRKKDQQITFLHVYHHSTMLLNWWLGVKYIAGGQSFFLALLNTFVHILMYGYYGLSALGPHVQKYLWWKKYITKLQLPSLQDGITYIGCCSIAVCTILTAAICILSSDILLTQNIDDFSVNGLDADYGWGFALTLVGMGIAVIAVVIMIVDLVKGGGNGKVNSNDEEK
ncbi:fatty acid elongase 3 [Mytilus galloprovincialis]|uniref:Elongation of very long chain fatty acids protein n=1 Tax=Mytilus galloprovincialis TaxID=29158 RepID=A0A8B6DFT2_MYTGA|nr:fatty acid elongase 3 [Mytilus galloprovincialis]